MLKKIMTLFTAIFLLSISSSIHAHTDNHDNIDISKAELVTMLEQKKSFLLLDVRSDEEYQQEHIPTAINIDYSHLADNLEQIKQYKDKEIVVYCRSGRRAGVAIDILKQNGFTNVKHLDGDMQGWQATALPHNVH